MEPAVSTVLADFRLTAWDVFEDWRFFQASNRAEEPLLRPQVAGEAELDDTKKTPATTGVPSLYDCECTIKAGECPERSRLRRRR